MTNPAGSSRKEDTEHIMIVSDGTPKGTHVFLQESGKMVANVQEIDWKITNHGLSVVTLTIARVPLETTVDNDQVQYRKIVL